MSMYGAVDIGGTKTLVAVIDRKGKVLEQIKFPTPENYSNFTQELTSTVAKLSTNDFQRTIVAVPGVIDRDAGTIISLGNLPWAKVDLEEACEKIFNCPVSLENDAKLAGLAEASHFKSTHKKILYVTISTGIGIALINEGVIDDAIGDTGGHDMYVEFNGKRITWEQLASGKAIVKEYGKRASEINDPVIWDKISRKIAVGLIDLIALLQPEVIVFGGGVGAHFSKYEKFLRKSLASYETPMSKTPKLVQAKHPEEAVIYGCYELAKTHYGRIAQKT